MSITIKDLFDAKVHYGHDKERWNPKMAPYIYKTIDRIHIFDLSKTLEHIETAKKIISAIVKRGGKALLVGTKKQASNIIKEVATDTNNYYVNERWLGGMLTNNATIRKSIGRLEEIEGLRESGDLEKFVKKEILALEKEEEKLNRYLGGIREMTNMPDLLIVVDPIKEKNAVKEARNLGIPIIAIADTNTDPDDIDYIIPGNDDGLRSISIILNELKIALGEQPEVKEEVKENDIENVEIVEE